MPMVGHLAENGLVLADEFREENVSPGARNLEFIKDCQAQIDATPETAWRSFENGQITEVIHSMGKTEKAFRLVLLRRYTQGHLFASKEKRVRYTVIASNREKTAEETILWYGRRGDTSENRIKELKIGFGMERLPCGDFCANAVFFRLGTLAYNLFVLFKILALPREWVIIRYKPCDGDCIRLREKSSPMPGH